MKALTIITAAALATLAVAGCDRPGTKTGANAPSSSSSTAVTSSSPPAATSSSSATQTADNTAPNTPATTSSASTPSASTGTDSTNVVSDTLVTGKVKAAIAADSGMKDADVSVKTENGVVTLTGAAKSPDQVTLAAALAQRQEGVSRVDNQVAVK